MTMGREARTSVLVVDHDPVVAQVLINALESAAYRVWHAADGKDARDQIERARPDLILLDLVLPDVDGLVLCSQLKAMTGVPIVICSGTARRGDPVLSLKLGADDFVRKPFDTDNLLARIEAVLRRAYPRADGRLPAHAAELRVGDLVVDPGRRRATLAGRGLILTPTEFRLLSVLAADAETVLSREHLAQQVWGYADISNGRTIDVHVRRLRVKLVQGPGAGPSIISVRGMGYRLTADQSAITAA